jgi:hypothetical protein
MLCFYRKEVLIISFSTAVLLNLVMKQRFFLHLLPFTNNEVMEQVRIKYSSELLAADYGLLDSDTVVL